jgi:hypothetical protein
MNWTKEWQRRGHKVVQSGMQFSIGAGNTLIGPDGIKGTGIGMRTIVGGVGALTAAMGSDFGADAMWAAIGSASEAAGEATVNFWLGNKRPAADAVAGASAPAAEAPKAQVAPAPVDVAIPEEMFRAAVTLAAMSPEQRAKVMEAAIEASRGETVVRTKEGVAASNPAPALRPTGT